jgi:hypothetical protein
MPLKVLLIGDIVGKLGRRTVAAVLPEVRRTHAIDFVIANGENTAGGRGLTPATATELFDMGVDVITSGNHIWENREIYPALDSDPRILRPMNYPSEAPGGGIYERDGIAVLNAMGRTFMGVNLEDPFRALDSAIDSLAGAGVIIVDFHAEATSEKIALANYLDGRVSAVVGTHTHVPTSDTRVLPEGTGYVTDLGMVGALNSVLGMEIEPVIERFLTQLPNRFGPVDKGPAVFNSVLIEIDTDSGRALNIERLDREIA